MQKIHRVRCHPPTPQVSSHPPTNLLPISDDNHCHKSTPSNRFGWVHNAKCTNQNYRVWATSPEQKTWSSIMPKIRKEKWFTGQQHRSTCPHSSDNFLPYPNAGWTCLFSSLHGPSHPTQEICTRLRLKGTDCQQRQHLQLENPPLQWEHCWGLKQEMPQD